MPYQIEMKDGFFEVSVTGETSKQEILGIIRELSCLDRGKQRPDLWHFSRESQLPFVYFADIAEGTGKMLPRGSSGSKTAIVAVDAFQEAQLGMYRSEASFLPFPIRVFQSRDKAIEWIRTPASPDCPSEPAREYAELVGQAGESAESQGSGAATRPQADGMTIH
jgi:hypothetical protein